MSQLYLWVSQQVAVIIVYMSVLGVVQVGDVMFESFKFVGYGFLVGSFCFSFCTCFSEIIGGQFNGYIKGYLQVAHRGIADQLCRLLVLNINGGSLNCVGLW
jgi:hypothetical protein